MSRVICPNCGSEVILSDKSEVVVGTTISKEGNTTYVLNMENKENKTMSNAEVRKAKLEQNGISTDGYFALQLPSGKTVYVDENGDKVDISIVGNNIGNAKLYRRWVMAQWFRQFYNPNGYAYVVSQLTYDYQWKMIANELKTLAKLQKEDKDFFNERIHFFGINHVAAMLDEYVTDIENTIKHRKTKKCKGVPYYHIAGRDIFVADIDKKLLNPLKSEILSFKNSIDYDTAYKRFVSLRTRFLKVFKPDMKYAGQVFKDRYKGAGAYYTLQNMVLYHGCTLWEYSEEYAGRWRKQKDYKGMDAYKFMKSLLHEYEYEGWRWVGVLKQCIEDNNFSFRR